MNNSMEQKVSISYQIRYLNVQQQKFSLYWFVCVVVKLVLKLVPFLYLNMNGYVYGFTLILKIL